MNYCEHKSKQQFQQEGAGDKAIALHPKSDHLTSQTAQLPEKRSPSQTAQPPERRSPSQTAQGFT
ncbi:MULTISPECIES: hypothetical protein [Arthrospira]|uniref:hypothetical protein n=1 Tax=Oscillatoriales TaxID=1150 RepID=UPI0001D0ED1E|nr:hypothetical protein [Arthrospira platensis]AMW27625.1 hypothetical protein AP285_06210 [Arthrospira platensis YZ]KDR57781.1 hypothetical protein APPUASWS_008970 [Arthrospira platensis str. Paraca]MBD2671708.1 hypothetical protein [Arthrospira platensis FACHB-439]MBD2712914.1 hypothetical protein [Arthrospira platensis FACHB-835]MDF2209925.1 hypothetical protein [Arthrospira platensis NCB002]MDT9185364.1 hypothetical protein [Limnospira sp. PMC 289.06]MDT9297757.1 hypothetical protein [Ar